jgi:hypothetical protein
MTEAPLVWNLDFGISSLSSRQGEKKLNLVSILQLGIQFDQSVLSPHGPKGAIEGLLVLIPELKGHGGGEAFLDLH